MGTSRVQTHRNVAHDVEVLSLTMNMSDATKHYCTKNVPHASLARRNYNHQTYFKKRTWAIAMSATRGNLHQLAIVELVAQAGWMLALQTHLDILLRHTEIKNKKFKNQLECKNIDGFMIVAMIIVIMINYINRSSYLNVNRHNLLYQVPAINTYNYA